MPEKMSTYFSLEMLPWQREPAARCPLLSLLMLALLQPCSPSLALLPSCSCWELAIGAETSCCFCWLVFFAVLVSWGLAARWHSSSDGGWQWRSLDAWLLCPWERGGHRGTLPAAGRASEAQGQHLLYRQEDENIFSLGEQFGTRRSSRRGGHKLQPSTDGQLAHGWIQSSF